MGHPGMGFPGPGGQPIIAQHSRHPPRECSRFMPRGIKKKISQYLHVLPVIYDGGFSKWLAPRYVLLSLAMLWNQLNYITT